MEYSLSTKNSNQAKLRQVITLKANLPISHQQTSIVEIVFDRSFCAACTSHFKHSTVYYLCLGIFYACLFFTSLQASATSGAIDTDDAPQTVSAEWPISIDYDISRQFRSSEHRYFDYPHRYFLSNANSQISGLSLSFQTITLNQVIDNLSITDISAISVRAQTLSSEEAIDYAYLQENISQIILIPLQFKISGDKLFGSFKLNESLFTSKDRILIHSLDSNGKPIATPLIIAGSDLNEFLPFVNFADENRVVIEIQVAEQKNLDPIIEQSLNQLIVLSNPLPLDYNVVKISKFTDGSYHAQHCIASALPSHGLKIFYAPSECLYDQVSINSQQLLLFHFNVHPRSESGSTYNIDRLHILRNTPPIGSFVLKGEPNHVQPEPRAAHKPKPKHKHQYKHYTKGHDHAKRYITHKIDTDEYTDEYAYEYKHHTQGLNSLYINNHNIFMYKYPERSNLDHHYALRKLIYTATCTETVNSTCVSFQLQDHASHNYTAKLGQLVYFSYVRTPVVIGMVIDNNAQGPVVADLKLETDKFNLIATIEHANHYYLHHPYLQYYRINNNLPKRHNFNTFKFYRVQDDGNSVLLSVSSNHSKTGINARAGSPHTIYATVEPVNSGLTITSNQFTVSPIAQPIFYAIRYKVNTSLEDFYFFWRKVAGADKYHIQSANFYTYDFDYSTTSYLAPTTVQLLNALSIYPFGHSILTQFLDYSNQHNHYGYSKGKYGVKHHLRNIPTNRLGPLFEKFHLVAKNPAGSILSGKTNSWVVTRPPVVPTVTVTNLITSTISHTSASTITVTNNLPIQSVTIDAATIPVPTNVTNFSTLTTRSASTVSVPSSTTSTQTINTGGSITLQLSTAETVNISIEHTITLKVAETVTVYEPPTISTITNTITTQATQRSTVQAPAATVYLAGTTTTLEVSARPSRPRITTYHRVTSTVATTQTITTTTTVEPAPDSIPITNGLTATVLLTLLENVSIQVTQTLTYTLDAQLTILSFSSGPAGPTLSTSDSASNVFSARSASNTGSGGASSSGGGGGGGGGGCSIDINNQSNQSSDQRESILLLSVLFGLSYRLLRQRSPSTGTTSTDLSSKM